LPFAVRCNFLFCKIGSLLPSVDDSSLGTSEKKKILESIKLEIDAYLTLEDKLNSLPKQSSNDIEDPNATSEKQVLKEEMSGHLKKIISTIEENHLVDDMPKDIASVYAQLKKEEV
jgi:hypothetical protein